MSVYKNALKIISKMKPNLFANNKSQSLIFINKILIP